MRDVVCDKHSDIQSWWRKGFERGDVDLVISLVISRVGDEVERGVRDVVPVIGVREGVSGVSGDTPVGLETSGSLEVS